MKTLDVEARLEYARAGVAVLRGLQIADSTMRYGEFAAAIGLKSGVERWQAWHRQQVAEILNLISAAEKHGAKAPGVDPLQYKRIVTEKGKPGSGISKTSKIVREKARAVT